jgi:hypothetical protein
VRCKGRCSGDYMIYHIQMSLSLSRWYDVTAKVHNFLLPMRKVEEQTKTELIDI